MAVYERRLRGDFDSVLWALENGILQSAASMRLVEQSDITCTSARVAVRVYDQYFMRNSSRASLSVTVVGADGEICVSAIGAGGGQGVIFNFSYGAESKLVNVVRGIVESIGE